MFFSYFASHRAVALRFTKMGRFEPHGVLVFWTIAGKIAAFSSNLGPGNSSPCSLCKSSMRQRQQKQQHDSSQHTIGMFTLSLHMIPKATTTSTRAEAKNPMCGIPPTRRLTERATSNDQPMLHGLQRSANHHPQ